LRLLVLDGELLDDAVEHAGADDDVIAIAPTAAELEALQQAVPDPRVFYLIGDDDVLPLPDAFVDEVYGTANTQELDRVRRP
jgi:hypothetical protein